MASIAAVAVAAASILPILQSRVQHADALAREVSYHRASLEQIARHHREQRRLENSRFERESRHQIGLDMQRYRVRLAQNSRVAMKDASHQRFQANQCLLLVAGLFLGCAYCIIGQGVLPTPPPEPSPLLLFGHSLGTGVGVGSLLVAVWCCVKAQRRMSYFDFGTSFRRKDYRDLIALGQVRRPGSAAMSSTAAPSGPRRGAHSAVVYTCGNTHETFNEYFDCHVDGLRWWSLAFLQLGAVAVQCGGWFFASLTIFSTDTVSKAILLACLAGGTVVVIIAEVFFPDRTTLTEGRMDFGGLRQDVETERKFNDLMAVGEQRSRREPIH